MSSRCELKSFESSDLPPNSFSDEHTKQGMWSNLLSGVGSFLLIWLAGKPIPLLNAGISSKYSNSPQRIPSKCWPLAQNPRDSKKVHIFDLIPSAAACSGPYKENLASKSLLVGNTPHDTTEKCQLQKTAPGDDPQLPWSPGMAPQKLPMGPMPPIP